MELDELPIVKLAPLVGDKSKLGAQDLETLREIVWRKSTASLGDFLEAFWRVETIGTGFDVMTLRPYQHGEASVLTKLMSVDRPREVRLKARQIGMTTIAAASAFWSAYFRPYHPWLISSRTEHDAIATVKFRIKQPMLMLPKWIQERGPELQTDTQQLLEWDNGSWIESIPASSGAGRSKAVFGVLVDESAFVEDGDDIFAALDPLCYGPMIVFSTANGMGNFFHGKWKESQRHDSEWNKLSKEMRPDEPFYGAFQPWHVVPERGPFTEDEDGKVTSAWYRRERLKHRDQPWVFYQEHPSSPEEAFARSGRVALNVDAIRLSGLKPPQYRVDVSMLDVNGDDLRPTVDTIIPDGEERDLEFWIWEGPHIDRYDTGQVRQRPNYVVAVDVAEGLSHGDRTSIVVIDANANETVATFRGHFPVEDLGDLIWWVGQWYHIALVGVERNNHGLVPLTRLRALHYPRLYRMDSIAQIKRGDRTPRYGWHTNRSTKPKMVQEFNKALSSEVITLRDERLLEEASTFIMDGKGGYGATAGQHDDHIIGHLIGQQLVQDVGEYPILWQDPKVQPFTMGEMMEIGFGKGATGNPLDVGIGQSAQPQSRKNSWVAKL